MRRSVLCGVAHFAMFLYPATDSGFTLDGRVSGQMNGHILGRYLVGILQRVFFSP